MTLQHVYNSPMLLFADLATVLNLNLVAQAADFVMVVTEEARNKLDVPPRLWVDLQTRNCYHCRTIHACRHHYAYCAFQGTQVIASTHDDV